MATISYKTNDGWDTLYDVTARGDKTGLVNKLNSLGIEASIEDTNDDIANSIENGVTEIYDAVVAKGSTPESKTIDDITDSIANIDTMESFSLKVTAYPNSASGGAWHYSTSTVDNLGPYKICKATVSGVGDSNSSYKSYRISTNTGTTIASGGNAGSHTLDISAYTSISFYSTGGNGRGHSATLTFYK